MNPLVSVSSVQEMARRNNENVAVYAAYQRRRRLRRFALAGKKKT